MGKAVGMSVVQFQAHHALAILELSIGRYAEALRAAEFATDRPAIGWRPLSLPLVVEAEFAVEIGRLRSVLWTSWRCARQRAPRRGRSVY